MFIRFIVCLRQRNLFLKLLMCRLTSTQFRAVRKRCYLEDNTVMGRNVGPVVEKEENDLSNLNFSFCLMIRLGWNSKADTIIFSLSTSIIEKTTPPIFYAPFLYATKQEGYG